jgi:NAD(P)-dependent dehydrogenase (short-subunit alcohol dehydrogenase family)
LHTRLESAIVASIDLSTQPIASLISLQGRTAVVTGGAAGIGLGIAHRLAEAGARVVIADLCDTGEAVAQVAQRSGAQVAGVSLDVTDSAAISACVEFTTGAFGTLDIWVNNAGIYPAVSALDITDDQWDAVLAVNLRGAFIGAREAAREMVRSGTRGVIVNVASVAAFRAAGLAHYVASKHGMHGLTKSLACEWGALGIRVLTVAPGMIQTPGIAVRTRDIVDVDIHAAVAARLPLRRIGMPDDVARAVLFCVSDLAAFMTGSALLVDGGDMAV